MLNLYLLSQRIHRGYDTYDSCVVAAENEVEATLIHPGGSLNWNVESGKWCYRDGDPTCSNSDWVNYPNEVTVTLIGTAADNVEKGVVIASFNAG